MTKQQHQIIGTWIFGALSFLFLIGVFLFAPEELPPFKHKILAILSALLIGLLSYFLTGTIKLVSEGKIPSLGKVAIQGGGGLALFVITLFWWNSEYAPV